VEIVPGISVGFVQRPSRDFTTGVADCLQDGLPNFSGKHPENIGNTQKHLETPRNIGNTQKHAISPSELGALVPSLSDRECFLPKNSNFLRAPLFSIPTKYCSSVTRELFRCTQVWTLTLLRARRAVCACSRWCRQDLIHGVVTVTALVWQARALTQCHSTLGITPPHVILV